MSSIFFSLIVYSLLSYILVAQRITIPVSIIMFTLILGLTKYYSKSYNDIEYFQSGMSGPTENSDNAIDNVKIKGNHIHETQVSAIVFIAIFAVLLIICSFGTMVNSQVFISWNNIDWFDVIQLATSIAIGFFIPGYAILLIIGKSAKINPVPRVLLAYLFSILITGLSIYTASSFLDVTTPMIKNLLIFIYLIILVALVFRLSFNRINSSGDVVYAVYVNLTNTKMFRVLKTRKPEILVFGSILALLITSTYYLYEGITIGDQWFHQGRALLFMSGSFREAILEPYPPFQSALLAGVTSLSGVPLVNAYASIAFLNIVPVFAFYYFFSRWVPRNLNRASLLACSLFAVGSGFNWIYFIGPVGQPIFSEHSFLEAIYRVSSVSIVQPTNFIFAANPDFSTGLIYLALPAGFTLLGLLRERFENKIILVVVTSGVSIVGSLAHPEFYYFMIVGSVLLFFFSSKKEANYMYLGLAFALAAVFVINKIFLVNVSIENFGPPLTILVIFLVLFFWGLFMTRQILSRSLKQITFIPLKFLSKLKHKIQRRYLISILIVSVITYLYGLSLIISTQSSLEDLNILTADYKVPWFFYAIKLGIIGFLGMVFILSYLFKKFEKTIFVFGIIILVAVFTGSYYDEHRFSKYTMAGIVGFASLLVYKILNLRYENRLLVNAIVIPSIIIFASISILLFIGYNSLVVQTHDYSHNPKKNFPSISELRLFDTLRGNIGANLTQLNVLSSPNEYKEGNLITRIQAFSGFSDKIYEGPLTLNASTLETFYRLLDDSDAKYIVIPKNNITDGRPLSYPAGFALDYFPIIYQDDKYIILEVPPITAPSSDLASKVALIYEKKLGMFPSEVLNKTLLHYNKETFDLRDKTDFVNITQDTQSEKIIIYGNKTEEGITVWSKEFQFDQIINYAQVEFRILSENEEESNDAGLQWKEGDKQYYASISRKGLTVSQKNMNDVNNTKIEFENPKIEKKDGSYYTLKIESLDNSINVYVDDILKIQIPRTLADKSSPGISNIGLGSFHNIAEFRSLEVGKNKINYDNYYYPLSALALSGTNYDTYIDGDLAALSNKIIILPFDPVDWNDAKFDKYLTHVKEGGKLVIIDSGNNFKGRFSRLFSIETNSNQTVGFRNIVDNEYNKSLSGFSGTVNQVQLPFSPDTKIIGSYMNETSQPIVPFAIGKNFSNGGSIVLVNAEGYYNEISKFPRKHFSSLMNMLNLLNINFGGEKVAESSISPWIRFIGDLQLSGNITLKSSSLLFGHDTNTISPISATRMDIWTHNEKQNKIFNNVSIKDFALNGEHENRINLNGTISLPGLQSHNSYFGMSVPNGFNMTLKIVPNKVTSSEVFNISNLSLPLKDISTIRFHNVTSGLPQIQSVPVLLMSPEINVNGISVFKSANFDGNLPSKATPLNVTGNLNAKLDFVDNYQQDYFGRTRTQYITYLDGIKFDGTTKWYEVMQLKLFDISESVKTFGIFIPWEVLVSKSGIILLLVVSMIAIILWRLRQIRPI